MEEFWKYTHQINPMDGIGQGTLTKHSIQLKSGDMVLIASDGVFDNMSTSRLAEILGSQGKIDSFHAVDSIFEELNNLRQAKENQFWGTYKEDNIGLIICQAR